MSDREKKPDNHPFSEWLKSQTEAWDAAWKQSATLWQGPWGTPAASPGEAPDPAQEEMWKGLFGMFENVLALIRAAQPGEQRPPGSVSDLLLRIVQPLWGSAILMQKRWMDATGLSASSMEQENLAGTAKQLTKAWYDAQAEDIRKLLHVPPLGMTRFYQEHVNQAVEKAMDFRTALTEFLQVLMIPLEKAHYDVQEQVARMQKEGKEALRDSRALYQLWINRLEEHYMALLRSDDYMNTLRGTLNALHDYRAARAQFFMDLLQDLPVPTHREMDELYKDLHTLKKRVRELERKAKRNGK